MLGNDLLEGELVRLTPVLREDLPDFVGWYTSLEYFRYFGTLTRLSTLEHEEEWFSKLHKDKDNLQFAIRPLEQIKAIGYCLIMDIHWQAQNCTVGIGIGAPDYRDKGYGSDALRVLLKYCFMELNMHRVGLSVIGFNERAIQSYRKVGFTQDAVAREAMLRDGRYYDSIEMSILRHEWEALYQEGE